MTSKKLLKKKNGCVRRKPRVRHRWPTVRLTLAGRKPGFQRGLPGFFYHHPKN
jgi:hypothetical protein